MFACITYGKISVFSGFVWLFPKTGIFLYVPCFSLVKAVCQGVWWIVVCQGVQRLTTDIFDENDRNRLARKPATPGGGVTL